MKRIAVALSVLTVLVLAAPVGAELCEKCKGKMYIMSVGKCVECGGFTGSGAHKLCRKCSAKLGQCEHCRAKLHAGDKPPMQKPKDKPILIKPKPGPTPVQPIRIDLDKILQPGTHVSGKWKYVYTIRAKGSKSEGHYVKLFYDGKEVPKPAGINDHYKTPWGLLYWVGDPRVLWGRHGWMPPGKLTAAKPGKLLPSPAKSAPAYLRTIELDESSNGKTVSAIVGQQIIIRLKGAPVPG
ncbi:MAG: hypothetical protein KAV00_18030, partial [Phycisphaerae bacterium]|nr:hypothetical protein [Phycisphaerae bacterium]